MIRSCHPVPASSRWPRRQHPPTHQVVRRRREGHDPIDFAPTAMPQLSQQPDGLHPPEGLFDLLATALTERIPGMARGPDVDRTALLARVLRDVRRDAHAANGLDPRGDVEVLVATDGHTGREREFAEHVQGRITFGGAQGIGHGGVDDKAVSILGQQMGEVAEFGLTAHRLLVQPRLGVGRRLMGVVAAPFAVEN